MKEKHLGRTIFKIIVIIILCIFLIILYGHFIGTKGLKIREYKVIDKSLPSDFYGLKIVHLSDIHYGYYYDIKKLEKLVEKVNKLNPDIIVFTGDLIDVEVDNEEKEKIIEVLNKLEANIGKFAVNGNLDITSFNEIIDRSSFKNLNNDFEIIYSKSDKVMIAGMSSNLNSNDSIDNKLNEIYNYIDSNKIKFKILLMHEPDYVDKLKNKTFNLIFAGHSHNGQIKLPIIGVIRTPNGSKKYYKEYYNTNKGKLYISGGIGTSVLPVRLFNKPSINFYRITNK